MTISDVALTQALTAQLSAQQTNIDQLEDQLSSGQALNLPSDDPSAVTQVLALSSQASQLTSWQSNASAATSWLGTANNAANSVLDTMQSAQTVLLQALNQGTQDSSTYQALGQQLQGVVSNLIALANTQYEGRAIFAGTSASPQAYDAAGNYLGNGDSPTVVIGPGSGSGQSVDLSVPGTAMFGSGASSVFTTLSAAATALLSGTPTTAQLTAAVDGLDTAISTAQQASEVLGNASQEAASATSSLTTQISSIQSSQAELEDVNVATTTTQLDTELSNYQAALWATSQAVPETLVKFISP
jgi:flagellar hook-associated protein 3 FlgL